MPNPATENIVIIGSGAAGYTAAIYTSRARLRPLLFTGLDVGGQMTITTEVENIPGFPDGVQGPELMENMKRQAEKFGTRMLAAVVTGTELAGDIKTVYADQQAVKCHTVIIATGALAQWLNIPGEKEYRGRGVSACATCDGFFFRDKTVAVIGGGDTALEEALFLTKFCETVRVVHRRDKLRASRIMQERALQNKKIEFNWNKIPVSMDGDGGKITGLTVRDTLTGSESRLAVDGIFVAIGHKPATDLFRNQLTLDEKGYIIVKDQTTLTSVAGVFAAGDVADPRYRQAVSAAGMGCRAAIDANRYLEERGII